MYVFLVAIALLWKSGAILDLPCPSVIPSIQLSDNFLPHFSRTVRVTKVLVHTYSVGLVYRVYRDQRQGPTTLGITSFDRFYNLPFMKNFCYSFLRNYESCKVETWYTHGQWADVSCVPESGPRAYNSWSYISLDRFYNLLLMKFFVTLFLRTVRVTKLKLGTHMESGLMYCVYQNQGLWPITFGVKSLGRFYNLPSTKNFSL